MVEGGGWNGSGDGGVFCDHRIFYNISLAAENVQTQGFDHFGLLSGKVTAAELHNVAVNSKKVWISQSGGLLIGQAAGNLVLSNVSVQGFV